MSRSLINVLQARRLRPLMRMASEPQMPWAHERRKVSDPSCSHLILCSASSTRSVGSTSTSKSCQRGSVSRSGSNRRMINVIVEKPSAGRRLIAGLRSVSVTAWGIVRVTAGSPSWYVLLTSELLLTRLVLPLHRLVAGHDDRLPVEPDVVVRRRRVGVTGEVRHRVLHVVRVVG